MSTRLRELGIEPERFAAVDGSAIDDSRLHAFRAARPHNLHPWTKGEMGCFLSHHSLWALAAISPDPYTAIFEDDLCLADAMGDLLCSTDWIPPAADLVRFEASDDRVRLMRAERRKIAGRSVRRIAPSYNKRFWAFGAGSYIISRKAALKVISVPADRHCNADLFLFNTGISPTAAELAAYQVYPATSVQYKRMVDPSMHQKYPSAIEDADFWASCESETRASIVQRKVETVKRMAVGYRKVPFADG